MTQVFCNLSHSKLQFGGRKEGSKIVAPTPACITEIPRPPPLRREKGGNFCRRSAAGKRQASSGLLQHRKEPPNWEKLLSCGKSSCAGGEAPGKMLQGRKAPRDGFSGCCGSEPGDNAELPGTLSQAGGDAREAQPEQGSRTERVSLQKKGPGQGCASMG